MKALAITKTNRCLLVDMLFVKQLSHLAFLYNIFQAVAQSFLK